MLTEHKEDLDSCVLPENELLPPTIFQVMGRFARGSGDILHSLAPG